MKPQFVKQLSGLALVAIMAAGCSSAPSADASVFDQVRDLGQELNRAVSATQDAATGFAEPQFATRAIDRASTSSRQLAETAIRVQTPDLRSATGELVATANRIVTHLSRAEVQEAESLRANAFVPLASQVAQMKASMPETSLTQNPPNGSSIGVAFVVVALVVGGVAWLLMRGRNRPAGGTANPDSRRPAEPAQPTSDSERNWMEPHPLYATAQESEPVPSDGADSARATRMRPIDIELRSLLESTIDQAREREWQVSLVCPEVHISGDPVRVQRAILATLGNVFLEGAELVGIVVDVVDGQVLVSIGHDAPIDDPAAEDIADRLANLLAVAIDHGEPAWSVAADGDVYLTTVSAGRQRVLDKGAEVGADEVSEPVA